MRNIALFLTVCNGIVRASYNSVFDSVMNYYPEELDRTFEIILDSVEAHIKVYVSVKNLDASMAVEVLNEVISANIIATCDVVVFLIFSWSLFMGGRRTSAQKTVGAVLFKVLGFSFAIHDFILARI